MTPSLPGDASWGSPHGARCVNKQTFVAAENQKVLLATGAIQSNEFRCGVSVGKAATLFSLYLMKMNKGHQSQCSLDYYCYLLCFRTSGFEGVC